MKTNRPDLLDALRESTNYFLDSAALVPVDAWLNVALGVWSVRDLVGHTSRALSNISLLPRNTRGSVSIASPGEYFVVALAQAGAAEAIAERGRRQGEMLPDDPVPELKRQASDALSTAEQVAGDSVIETPSGRMRFDHYLYFP
ncbi:MAG: hypothetical protein WD333_04815 [Dehalococcoidia bacterium]